MNQITNDLHDEKTIHHEESLKKMAILLDELGQKAYHRLVKTKENYRKTIPRRYQLLQNIKMASKFDAGESLGGEFFDSILFDKSITFLISRSASYKVSSFVIDLFIKYKESGLKDLNQFKSFFRDVAREIEELDLPENKDLIHLMLFRFDFELGIIEGFSAGGHTIVFSDGPMIGGNNHDLEELDFENFYFKKEISKVEKFVITSSGLRENFHEKSHDQDVSLLIKEKLNLNIFDFLDEIFFYLRKDERYYLTYDSSLVAFEVL